MPNASKAKKLVSILATSASVTSTSKKAQVTQVTHEGKNVILDWVPCIHYPVQFRKNKEATIQVLIDSGSEVNVMTPAYAKILSFWTQRIDVRAQKIDGSSLDTLEIIIASF